MDPHSAPQPESDPDDSPAPGSAAIPPRRQHSAAVPVPITGIRRRTSGDQMPVGGYRPRYLPLVGSPISSSTSSSLIGDREFSEDSSGPRDFPVGFDSPLEPPPATSPEVNVINLSGGAEKREEPTKGLSHLTSILKPLEAKTTETERRALQEAERAAKAASKEKREEATKEALSDLPSISKPLEAETTETERRALQEAETAAKAASKADGTTAVAESGGAASSKSTRHSSQKKDGLLSMSLVATNKKSGDRPLEKKKKHAPLPQMQFDDENRVEKARRRAVFDQTEARHRVELFLHLPQYEHGTRLAKLESMFFQLDSLHPAVWKVGLRYLSGDISGSNARCIEMLLAFQEAIKDYSTPPAKVLVKDLTAKINSYVSFFAECRPLSISMGNAIRFVKSCIANLHSSRTESEAKETLSSHINQFINERIILADKVIVGHAATKVSDGDVLLTYGSSCVVEMILLHAHEIGKQFRVVVVDLRPKFESQALLRRLVAKGLSCTYTHVNAVSYVMHEVTRIFLGASSIMFNGTVNSRVGTACVAMVAHAYGVPVLICCEAYKFHKRVQLDSICSNELGDPGAVAVVPGRMDINYLDNWTSQENLQLLNLYYDATPSDYVSAIVTDHGIIPPTSVPVILRVAKKSQQVALTAHNRF
uniref:Translation initiation factor eIF2B subunit delta n=1 Tax=Cajanus cajan TaxID=3821 RepID=A0A151SM10_CAJCA|nr:Translation initiation factor eIF-2B subunit delta [Cajanus cajan]